MNCCENIKLCEYMKNNGSLKSKINAMKDIAIAIKNSRMIQTPIYEMLDAIIRIAENYDDE
jgi:hypothetical protein